PSRVLSGLKWYSQRIALNAAPITPTSVPTVPAGFAVLPLLPKMPLISAADDAPRDGPEQATSGGGRTTDIRRPSRLRLVLRRTGFGFDVEAERSRFRRLDRGAGLDQTCLPVGVALRAREPSFLSRGSLAGLPALALTLPETVRHGTDDTRFRAPMTA